MAQALTGILGAGAMGQLLAHQLVRINSPTVLLRRPGSAPGTLTHRFHSLEGKPEQRTFEHRPSDQPTPLSCLLVLTKAHQCLDALVPVMNWLSTSTPLVLLHNGMGPQFDAQQRWPAHNFWAGSLSDGALAIDRQTVRHTGLGQRWAGSLQDDASLPLPLLLQQLGFSHHPDPRHALWQKLTVNLVINPLTARDRVTNGTLLSPQYRDEVALLCREIATIGQALGFDDNQGSVLDRVMTVAEATATNRSSMLQDVEAGRPTELDAITGYLLRQANALGLPCPGHQGLYQVLRQVHCQAQR